MLRVRQALSVRGLPASEGSNTGVLRAAAANVESGRRTLPGYHAEHSRGSNVIGEAGGYGYVVAGSFAALDIPPDRLY